MSNKHTPGPWLKKHTSYSNRPTSIHTHPMGYSVCSFNANIWDKRQEEATANANLIAAAPELLEALETIQEIFVNKIDLDKNFYRDKLVQELNTLIEKAKGG